MRARITILGGCGGWPEPGRACSGFVIEHEGYRLVLDLGYGTLPRLLGLLRSAVADGLDAVVITHEHADHMVDLHGLFRARWLGLTDPPTIALYAPESVLGKVVALEDPEAAEHVDAVFSWLPLPAGPYEVGPFTLESVALPHHVPTAGVRLTAQGLTIAYTGDTGPDPALVELGHGADLYIVDATHPTPPPPAPGQPRLLLSAAEAGELAAIAGARRLLLSHFWPGTDRELAVTEARRSFAGEVYLADEGTMIELP
ncbi:MAG: MBL fold metallo-hydrolase [Solirubrobacterales bacterium]|nr:MBL fold metallo-hydrolase [Solirubrobacterales bacterium]MBV9799359.1 MBL fold metallo-hydrolase [Solirubrobacterales bacterium]